MSAHTVLSRLCVSARTASLAVLKITTSPASLSVLVSLPERQRGVQRPLGLFQLLAPLGRGWHALWRGSSGRHPLAARHRGEHTDWGPYSWKETRRSTPGLRLMVSNCSGVCSTKLGLDLSKAPAMLVVQLLDPRCQLLHSPNPFLLCCTTC